MRVELTSLEELVAPRTELVAAARGTRRQVEALSLQLQGLAFWRGVSLSPLQVAEDVSFVEEYRCGAFLCVSALSLGDTRGPLNSTCIGYVGSRLQKGVSLSCMSCPVPRWLAYVLLLLLQLLVCLFTLLGLAKQSKWLVAV